jgi:hypothetical protein
MTFKLSYKILESQNNDTTLTMIVNLRAKNTGTSTIYGATARNISTTNVTIDAGVRQPAR